MIQPGLVMDAYLKEVEGIILDIHNNERERILQCARVIADHVEQDKLVYIWGPGGHSNLEPWRSSSGRGD